MPERRENFVYEFKFRITHPEERAAGLPYREEFITIHSDKGIFIDDVPSFVDDYIHHWLREWFEGAEVEYIKEGKE